MRSMQKLMIAIYSNTKCATCRCHALCNPRCNPRVLSPESRERERERGREAKCHGYPAINHNQISCLLWLCWGWRMKLINKSDCCNKSEARSNTQEHTHAHTDVHNTCLTLDLSWIFVCHTTRNWQPFPHTPISPRSRGNHLFMPLAKICQRLARDFNKNYQNYFAHWLRRARQINYLPSTLTVCMPKSDLHAQMNIKLLESFELRQPTHTRTLADSHTHATQWLWILRYAKSIIT